MIMASPSGGLPERITGTSMVMIGCCTKRPTRTLEILTSPVRHCLALQFDRVWISQRQRLFRRPCDVDELLSVLVHQQDPAAGQARPRAFGLAAELHEIVRHQRRGGRQDAADRYLLAQKCVNGAYQCASGIDDRFALILAFVLGELPDDARGQQQERQRHRKRDQHQAVADAPASGLPNQDTPLAVARRRDEAFARERLAPSVAVAGVDLVHHPQIGGPVGRAAAGVMLLVLRSRCFRRSAREFRGARCRSLPS